MTSDVVRQTGNILLANIIDDFLEIEVQEYARKWADRAKHTRVVRGSTFAHPRTRKSVATRLN